MNCQEPWLFSCFVIKEVLKTMPLAGHFSLRVIFKLFKGAGHYLLKF